MLLSNHVILQKNANFVPFDLVKVWNLEERSGNHQHGGHILNYVA